MPNITQRIEPQPTSDSIKRNYRWVTPSGEIITWTAGKNWEKFLTKHAPHQPRQKIDCPDCGGTGSKTYQRPNRFHPGATVMATKTCPTCKGKPLKVKSVEAEQVECGECEGDGRTDPPCDPCPNCHEGKVYQWRIEVEG